ncbi:nucleotidyltransferase domain-containing protein [Paenibacillus sp. IITD108]|uniref:nucleotidyltransferase domain-containing protein n=1 Tax=Paenibacillus sp. IITD108 TaxID=3116649 RepID=UPI002F401E75
MINNKVEDYFVQLAGLLEKMEVTCYIAGSYAMGLYIEGTSDLDITFIFKHENYMDNKNTILRHAEQFKLELDLMFFCENEIFMNPSSKQVREGILSPKVNGRLFWGKNVLDSWNLPSPKDYIESTIDLTLDFIKEARGLNYLDLPINYPNENDYFKGYIRSRRGKISTKLLVCIYTWIAGCRLAVEKGLYMPSKYDVVSEYKKHYDDGEYLATLLRYCRDQWGYNIPTDDKGLTLLHHYCAEALTWEKRFIDDIYIENNKVNTLIGGFQNG